MKLAIDRTEPTPEQVAAATPLLERAYALAYSPAKPPPPEELCMTLGEYPIAARGNLIVIQGKSKAGKSAVVSAVLGASMRGESSAKGDTLCLNWVGDASGAVIHFDTEQSLGDWHTLVSRSVARSGLPEIPSQVVSLSLVRFTRLERLILLEQVLEREAEKQGSIDCVVIDGIADLCKSPNDEAEALELVSKVHALCQQYDCVIVCVVHENPSTDAGKTRGHLGSELNRKAFANLRVDKDSSTGLSTLWGSEMRKRDIPRDQGFCFAWDNALGMHSFQGRSAGLKAARKKAEKAAKERDFFEPIFDAKRTTSSCLTLSVPEALEILRNKNETESIPTPAALRKRMERAKTLEVLGTERRGRWTLNKMGQNGHE